MPSRTQIVCLHEGERGRSIDGVFINKLLKALKPTWIRPWGSNVVRLKACGGRSELIRAMPRELQQCLARGGDTTLMVWADLDHDMAGGDQLKDRFWAEAKQKEVTQEQFAQVVFVFAKDRLENWIEFVLTGKTEESKEGPRQRHSRPVAEAAKALAQRCQSGAVDPPLPPSLAWSCGNWHALVQRMG